MKNGKRIFEAVMLFHLSTGKYVLPGDFCTPGEVLPAGLRHDITTALDRLEVRSISIDYFRLIDE